jgi:hypothetical protein
MRHAGTEIMSLQLFKVVRVYMVSLLALSTVTASARAQAPETFTATASVKSATGESGSAPITVVVERFASDAEREALIAAVKKGGTAARDLLVKRADLGTLQLGTRRIGIKYAYARETAAGRLITAVTAEPIRFIAAGPPETKPRAGYDLGLVLLELNPSGPGHGELAPAAKVRVDDQNAIVTEDYGAEVVRLSNVIKK